MSIPFIISAFLLGLTGSFHCIGMCGPIALAVPYKKGSETTRWLSFGIYLSGKTITYTLLGIGFGLLGGQVSLIGSQQVLSIISGSLLLLVVVLMIWWPRSYHSNPLQRLISDRLIPVFGKVLKDPTPATPFILGMLNGLLPCGLVYMGLLGASASGSAWAGGVFMLMFGIGTIPVMFSFLALATKPGYGLRQQVQRFTPVFVALVGIMLILRGMNLGIPFVSPDLSAIQGRGAEALSCHP